jgi:hypothetical protein
VVTRDGGSIYTQARNEGTVISGNHLIACNNDMGIYLDLGSGGYLVCSNVVERPYDSWLNVNNKLFPTNITNVVRDNFATTNHYHVGVLNENIVMVNNTTLSGTWPAAAVAITNHAGLEPGFTNILAKIPVAAIAARYAVNPANLTVTAPANTNIALGQKLCLKPVVTYPTLLNRPVYSVWSKVSGPTGGEVAFNAGAFADAEVRFGVPGTYVLQVTAGPGVRTPLDTYLIDAARSRSATMTVTVTGTVQTWQTNNVALNQPATATSIYAAGYPPEKAVDGTPSTLWASAVQTNSPLWWQVDLGSAKVVRRVEELSRQDTDTPTTKIMFRILASTTSDFSSYVVLAQENSGTPYPHKECWLEHTTNSTAFRYIRRESFFPELGATMAEFRVFALPPPGLAVIGNKTNNAGNLVTFTAAITNADPYMTYSYTLGTGAPAGAAIDAVTGVFTWTPPLTQVPGDYAFTVRVTDSGGQYSEQTFTVTVKAPSLGLLFRLN